MLAPGRSNRTGTQQGGRLTAQAQSHARSPSGSTRVRKRQPATDRKRRHKIHPHPPTPPREWVSAACQAGAGRPGFRREHRRQESLFRRGLGAGAKGDGENGKIKTSAGCQPRGDRGHDEPRARRRAASTGAEPTAHARSHSRTRSPRRLQPPARRRRSDPRTVLLGDTHLRRSRPAS